MFGKVARYGCVTIIFATITALLAILFLLPSYGRPLAWWMPVAFAVSMLLLIGAAKSYFSASVSVSITALEAHGLLATTHYKARRAFQVEQFEFDEGSQYFLELEDDSVLFVRGQYLWDYEPIDDDPELNRSRQFPCTEFTVRRHKQDGYGIDLQCGGQVIEPEFVAQAFTREDYDNGLVPEDGQIIRNRSYDQLKAERLARS